VNNSPSCGAHNLGIYAHNLGTLFIKIGAFPNELLVPGHPREAMEGG
jgi:hypothetical protein